MGWHADKINPSNKLSASLDLEKKKECFGRISPNSST